MSDGSKFDEFMSALQGSSTADLSKFRIATKRSRHSGRFAQRIEKNAQIAKQLVDVIKALNKRPGNEDEIDKLLDATRDMLENNAQLREQVEEALQDIPN
jgi:type I site-specific restriction-modification system R (restriction) subunit